MSANVSCATDVGVPGALGDDVQILPCCQVWRKKYARAEKGRNFLKQAVQLLQTKLDELQAENVNLKKANGEGLAWANMEQDVKDIELAARISLEKEILSLKSEISFLKLREVADAQEGNEEIKVLQARIFYREKEIDRLKELLDEEKVRADSEKKNAAVEKKKAAEALKRLEAEKGKADKERRASNLERKKAEDYKLQLEVLNNEIQEANSKLISEMTKFEEARKEFEAERLKVIEERKRADLEMSRAEEQRRLAEANMKKAVEETLHADSLSKQLEDARRRIEVLKKEMHVLPLSVVSAVASSGLQHININDEAAKKKKAPNLVLEFLQSEQLKNGVGMEKPDSIGDKKRADAKMKDSQEKGMNAEAAKTKHLKRRIKFGKQQLKHIKEVAKLEGVRSSILQRELGRMKLDLVQAYERMDAIDKCLLSPAGEFAGKYEDMVNVQRLKLKEKNFNLRSCQTDVEDENQLLAGDCVDATASDHLWQTCQHSSPLHAMFRGSYGKSILGTDSKFKSLHGVSNPKMLLSSAINSRAASFSNRQSVSSQEKGTFSVGMSATQEEDNLNGLATISGLSAEVSERRCNKNLGMVTENNITSPLPNDAGAEVFIKSRKRKRISDAVESIELSCSGIKELFTQVEDNLSILHGMVNRPSGEPSNGGKRIRCSSHSYSQAEHNGSSKKRRKSHGKKTAMLLFDDCGQPKPMEKIDIAVQGDADVLRQPCKLADDLTNRPKVHQETMFRSVSTYASFKDVADGDYMKLLDLDNADDEKSYRMAMKVPLSPNLPKIKHPGPGSFDVYNLRPLVDERMHEGFSNEKKSYPSSCSFDTIYMEINSNRLKHGNAEFFVSILLKELIAHSGMMMHRDVMVNSSSSTVLLHEDKIGQNSGCEEVSCVLNMNYDASCYVNKSMVPDQQLESSAKKTLCNNTDVLSLVELLASKMSWNWTCSEIIRPLLRMLDYPLTQDFTLSIIILLGQLGRFGIDAVGYEDTEMENLRSQLSAFLWRDTTIRAGLPIQLATLSAILGLIPFDIEKVLIDTPQKAPDITTWQSSPTDLLRNWFCLLSEAERALSVSLLKFPNEISDKVHS